MSSEILDDIFYKVKNILEQNKLFIEDDNYKSINYGIQFNITDGALTDTLRLYMNKKKELRIDYSQLKNLSYQIRTAIDDNIDDIYTKLSLKNDKKRVAENRAEYDLGYPIIGTDESGKGDYFGSLVTASVFVDQHMSEELIAIGVQDSKKISDTKILELEKMIKRICKNKYIIVEISPEKYNTLYNQFNNLNSLLGWAHGKAIEELLEIADSKKAIIDKFANESVILNALQKRGKKITIIQKNKAENNIAVAAASIMARARFIQKLKSMESEYSLKIPKGCSNKVVDVAKQFVSLHGRENLGKVVKLHFKTTKEL